jgi:integrase/recombinase XerD
MLSADIMRYVELHRAVGFRFHTQHQLLSSFAAFADAHGDEFVRIERALDWASRSSSPPQRRKRLLEVGVG